MWMVGQSKRFEAEPPSETDRRMKYGTSNHQRRRFWSHKWRELRHHRQFLYGITTSTTLLANGAAFNHAVDLASDHPDLEIGVHLNLTLGKPLLPDADSISANGRFHTREYVQQHAASLDLDEVYAEWHAQIERCARLASNLRIWIRTTMCICWSRSTRSSCHWQSSTICRFASL